MQYEYEDQGVRQRQMSSVHRIVVKIGTRLLMDAEGATPAERIEQLISEIAWLRQQGYEVILVSSGAIGAGMLVLGTERRPKNIPGLQAHAAVGQCHLMTLYEQACDQHGFHCGQLLLTAADLHDRDRHVKVAQCLDSLLAENVLPVLNENDSVCVDEIKVGDNDTLAALVASMCRADLTVLLTTVDGMRERDEETGALGRRISVVKELDESLMKMASGTDGNRFSVGGMITKLRAAAMASCCGDPLWIADGRDFQVLRSIAAGKDTGTLFLSSRKYRLHAKQRYLAFFAEPRGEVILDAGAEVAVRHQGKSLLPGGILGLRGIFSAGDTVRMVSATREEIGRGVAQYGTEELSRICGAESSQLEALLGHVPPAREVIHRNSMVVL